jgi:alkylation response protein AidB-like acyl-CoA dehydrogenase
VTVVDDMTLLIHSVRAFSRERLLPLDREWDIDESSMGEVLPEIAEMGFLDLVGSEDEGGLGCDYQTYASILHEISYASPSAAVAVAVHNMVGMLLRNWMSEPVRSEVTTRWSEAESFGAFAISEAGAGSDVSAIRTTAQRVGGGFNLNGEKMWITNGESARWFFVVARTSGSPGDKAGLSGFLLDGRSEGVGRTKIRGKMGIRGSETVVLHLDDAFVPDSHRVGGDDQGMAACLSALNGGRISIAAQASGISEACLDLMIAYAQERKQFNMRIADQQAIQWMIADSVVELEASKELIRRAAIKVNAGEIHPAASAMAKLYASEAANRIAYRAVQVHGGTGYVHECRAEQLYRDARVTTIYEGTSEIQRFVIAREALRDGLNR